MALLKSQRVSDNNKNNREFNKNVPDAIINGNSVNNDNIAISKCYLTLLFLDNQE